MVYSNLRLPEFQISSNRVPVLAAGESPPASSGSTIRIEDLYCSAALETAVRDWLKKSNTDASDDQAQRKLRAAAARCLGVHGRLSCTGRFECLNEASTTA
jgi:hypothetical protein